MLLSPLGLRARVVLACLLLVPTLACASGPGEETPLAYPPLEASDFGSMNNVSMAGPLWIGGMPTAEDLELAQRRGIERVIDVSVPSEPRTLDIPSECRVLGVEYQTLGLVDEGLLTSESVDLFLEELGDGDIPPTLMFCGTGSRCAMYLAIYRATRLGVPLEKALIEARRAGMEAGAPAAFVRAEVARLLAQLEADRQVQAEVALE